MSVAIIGAVAAVAGTAVSAVSASKANSTANKAIDANQTAQAAANQENYQNWLAGKGIGVNGAPQNAKLPLYMNSTGFGATPSLRRIGSGPVGGAANTPAVPGVAPVYGRSTPAAPSTNPTTFNVSLGGLTPSATANAVASPVPSGSLGSTSSAGANGAVPTQSMGFTAPLVVPSGSSLTGSMAPNVFTPVQN